jgi:hypothetical protein
MNRIVLLIALSTLLAACAPKVGSDAWCKAMQDKARGEWTMNETADFAKFCILKLDPDKTGGE